MVSSITTLFISTKRLVETLKEIFQINGNKLPLSIQLKELITNIEEKQMKHQWYYSSSTLEIYQLTKEITTYFSDRKDEIKVLNIASKEIYKHYPATLFLFQISKIENISRSPTKE